MGIILRVVELLHDGEIKGLGDFEFSNIPSPNDRVVVPAPSGDLDVMRVAYVEHFPVKVPKSIVTEDMNPTLMVYVEFADRFTG